jgi:hypothetical protein
MKNPGTLFWLVTALLCGYVGLCTGRRDSVREADAWEHHRSVLALVQDFRQPGNPTLGGDAIALPSIRYSPYTVALAVLCRATGMDPWDALSLAAVLNTALLCLGVWVLLAGLGRPDASGAALIVMVSVYGGAPGYANSYALADLPWHQVNPSAFAFAIVLFLWGLFLRLRRGAAPKGLWIALPLMLALALLDHPMTGFLGVMGLGLFAAAGLDDPGITRQVRLRRLGWAAAVSGLAIFVCLAWPWYGFGRALTYKPDNAYWFNPSIARRMVTEWCAPAVLLSLWALAARDRAVTRALLAGGAACLGAGLVGMAAKSATLARIPLAGLIFFHLAIAVTARDFGWLSRDAWKERFRQLRTGGPAAAEASLAAVATLVLMYGLVPQLLAIPREPHLARAYVAPLMGREDKQPRWRDLYRQALAPVGPRDVVFGDPVTTWPAPSFGARIVAPLHFEFFVPGQQKRYDDALAFFATVSEAERSRLLESYGARWLLVDAALLDERQKAELIRESSVRSRAGSLVLMESAAWRRK